MDKICFTDDTLIDYVEKRLSTDRSRTVELHLLECQTCKKRYQEILLLIEDIKSVFKSAPQKEISPELDSAIFSDMQTYFRHQRNMKALRIFGLATAAVILITISLIPLFHNSVITSQTAQDKIVRKIDTPAQTIKPTVKDAVVRRTYLKGDVNHDGVVDIRDVQLLQKQILEGKATMEDGDVNGDGVIDNNDVQAIVDIISRNSK